MSYQSSPDWQQLFLTLPRSAHTSYVLCRLDADIHQLSKRAGWRQIQDHAYFAVTERVYKRKFGFRPSKILYILQVVLVIRTKCQGTIYARSKEFEIQHTVASKGNFQKLCEKQPHKTSNSNHKRRINHEC